MFSARPLEEPSSKRLVEGDENGNSGPKIPPSAGKRKASDNNDVDDNSLSDDGDEDSVSDTQNIQQDGGSGGGNNDSSEKRSRRLAMNRASARARRKKKKVLLDSLANQVTELTKQNRILEENAQTLQTRAQQLETALSQAQATITSLVLKQKQTSASSPHLVGSASAALKVPEVPTRAALVGESLQVLLGGQQHHQQDHHHNAAVMDSILAGLHPVVSDASLLQSEQQKMIETQLLVAALERSQRQQQGNFNRHPAGSSSSPGPTTSRQFFQP